MDFWAINTIKGALKGVRVQLKVQRSSFIRPILDSCIKIDHTNKVPKAKFVQQFTNAGMQTIGRSSETNSEDRS